MSSSKLYIYGIVLLGIAFGYVMYSQWMVAAQEPIPPVPVSNQDNLTTFQNLKIDFSAIDTPAYKTLTISGEAPVNPGVTGKKDLFAPF